MLGENARLSVVEAFGKGQGTVTTHRHRKDKIASGVPKSTNYVTRNRARIASKRYRHGHLGCPQATVLIKDTGSRAERNQIFRH